MNCSLLISGNVTGSLVNQTLFQASVGQSYMCNSQQNFNITDNNINQMTLELVDLQVQAFLNQTTANFGTGKLLHYFTTYLSCRLQQVKLFSAGNA